MQNFFVYCMKKVANESEYSTWFGGTIYAYIIKYDCYGVTYLLYLGEYFSTLT